MKTLYVKAYALETYDSSQNLPAFLVRFTTPDYLGSPTSPQWLFEVGTQDPSATPYPLFPDVAAAIAYYGPTAASSLLSTINGQLGYAYYTTTDVEWIDSPVKTALDGLTFDDIDPGTTNKAFTATEKTKLGTLAGVAVSGNSDDLTEGSTKKLMTSAERTKLSGIATGATANSSDATLLARANHTGTQLASTISDFSTAVAALVTVPKSYEGTTLRSGSFPIFKNATVSSNIATFHLTNDGLSTGAALFPNGVIQDSVNLSVNDATAAYQMSWAFSNSNKTLTVTANKLTTANILTGILGQAAANAAVIKLQIWGY